MDKLHCITLLRARESIAEYLVKHSADIHSEDNDGSSSRDICSSKWPFMQHEEEVK
jgi:hypothetical protein